MTMVETSIWIDAPIERLFDLARDLNVHTLTTARTGERVVRRTGSGLMQLGDEVTFEARHLGVKQQLTSIIAELRAPERFVDEMVKGAFKQMRHEHLFAEEYGGTRMTDRLEFTAPLGALGQIVSRMFLARYMRRFLEQRGSELKRLAEAA